MFICSKQLILRDTDSVNRTLLQGMHKFSTRPLSRIYLAIILQPLYYTPRNDPRSTGNNPIVGERVIIEIGIALAITKDGKKGG